ncbi:MAG: molecular chaperone [Halodesulfurarchaeum sp.]
MSEPSTTTRAAGAEHPLEAAVFHLLGDLLLEPADADDLETVSRWAGRWLADDPPEVVAGALRPMASVDPSDVDDLNEAFTRLFRGITGDSPDPPYESLYRDGELHGRRGAAVREAYRESGMDVGPDTGELADHLGMELHFLGALLADGEEAAFRTFAREHPVRWVGELQEAVLAADPPPFYRGVLDLVVLVLDVAEGDTDA